jgi:hypothetical protein
MALIYNNEEIKQNLLNIFNNKKVYIFENDTCLQDSLENIHLFCKNNNIDVKVIFQLYKYPFHLLQDFLKQEAVILFETHMKSEIGTKIFEYICKNKLEQLTIIECRTRNTHYNRIPENLNITKINLDCFSEELDFWELEYKKNKI